jgi:hypothetical protein
MLAHSIKEVLTIVPEAMEFIKQASLEKDFPVDSKDSAAASYLTAAYLTKVAGKVLDIDLLKRLEKAATLYDVKTTMDKYIPRFSEMSKEASEEEIIAMVKTAEAGFEGDLCGFLNIEKAAEKATQLMQKYASKVTSEEVKRYSGNAYLDKSAAIRSLANRYHASKEQNSHFIKVARIIQDNIREDDFKTIGEVCRIVTTLDKQAGFDLIGFNPWREFLLTKQSALASGLTVSLAGKDVPWTKIASLGTNRIQGFLGKEASAGLTGDCVNDKYVLESMPRGLQMQLNNILRNV